LAQPITGDRGGRGVAIAQATERASEADPNEPFGRYRLNGLHG
jgi:hypothetical protein